MTGIESGERTGNHGPKDERTEGHECESLKAGREVGEGEDLEKRWARLAERVRKREEVEERLKRVGERFERKERELREAREAAEPPSGPVKTEPVTERSESTEPACSKAWERPCISSRNELDRAIEHHPEIRLRKGFEEDYGNAVENDCDRKCRGGPFADELDRMELRRLYTEAHGGPPDAHIDSMNKMRDVLQRYHDIELIEAEAKTCEKYYEAMRDRSAPLDELSKSLDVSIGQIARWRRGVEPPPVRELREREEERILEEWVHSTDLRKISEHEPSKMRLEHRFDSACENPEATVKEAIPVETKRPWTVDDLAEVTRRAYLKLPETSARVHYTDLEKSAGLSSKEVSELETAVSEDYARFEKMVQEKLRLDGVEAEIHVGMVDGKLYTWKPDLDPRNLVNSYGSLYFYFNDRDTLARFISEVKGKIQGDAGGGLHGTTQHLEKLISQMFPEDGKGHHVYNDGVRVRGDHLHLMLDMAGVPLKSLEGHISKVTKVDGNGGIDRPKFPEEKKLEVLTARFMATITSDGHIKKSGSTEYSEDHLERIKIVEEYLREFGDIRLKPRKDREENVYYCYITACLGEMLHHLGVTATNKSIENQGLPPVLYEFCETALRAYIEDLIPQDGTVSRRCISWFHSNALNPGTEGKRYSLKPKLDPDMVEFLEEHSKRAQKGRVITRGEWEKLGKSDSPETTQKAARLQKIVDENRNKLIDDEAHIARMLGIKVRVVADTINIQERTGKVCIAWAARTEGIREAVKLGMIAPPNDVRKRGLVKRMLAEHNDEVKKALRDSEDRGADIEKWWTDE